MFLFSMTLKVPEIGNVGFRIDVCTIKKKSRKSGYFWFLKATCFYSEEKITGNNFVNIFDEPLNTLIFKFATNRSRDREGIQNRSR